jgi:hypothetical protein
MRFRLNAVAVVAAEDFDEWLGPDGGQFAQRLHFSVAILALADFSYLLGHRATMPVKPVGTMKFCTVELRQGKRVHPKRCRDISRLSAPSAEMTG